MVIINGDSNQNQKFRVLEIGKSEPDGNNSWGPGMRDYYMIHLVTAGEGTFNNQKVKKGNYFFCTPYTKIHYYPNMDNQWEYVWIIFQGERSCEILNNYGFLTETGIGEFNFSEELTQLQSIIFSEEGLIQVNEDISVTTDKKINYWANLIFSMKSTDEDKKILTERSNVKNTHVKKAVEFINSSIHKKITPRDVAEFVKLDEKYLYSLFSQIEGCSLREYINRLRVEKAKNLLSFSNMNISEIAYSVGVDDPLYFSKLFRKYVGLSPKQYRKKLNESKN